MSHECPFVVANGDPVPVPGTRLPLSRRAFLFSAASSVLIPPSLAAGAVAEFGTVSFGLEGGRFVLRYGAVIVWVLDPTAYGPRASLRFDRSDTRAELTLRNAPYPGLPLDGEVRATFLLHHGQWYMRLRVGPFDFARWMRLSAWASGLDRLSTTLDVRPISIPNAVVQGVFGGVCEATFLPGGVLYFTGPAAARVYIRDHREQELVGDAFALAVLARDEPSLLTDPAEYRTVIEVPRGDRVWDFEFRGPTSSRWSVLSQPDSFGTLRLEVGWTATGLSVVTALQGAVRSRVEFVPDEGILRDHGGGHTVGVVAPRLVMGGEREARWAMLIGSTDSDPNGFSGPGFDVRTTPETLRAPSPFRLIVGPDGINDLRAEQSASIASLQLADAVDTRADLDITAVTFCHSTTRQDATGLCVVVGDAHGPWLEVKDPTLRLRRSADMLDLRIECVGFDLHIPRQYSFPASLWHRRRAPELRRREARAFIIVHFGSQHVLEESVFEADPAYGDPTGGPLPRLPLRSRRAGDSRVAFEVPASIDRIPFTVEALLHWNEWQPSLVPAAADAVPGTVPLLRAPTATETALEIPYRLILSPSNAGGWAHAIRPVTRPAASVPPSPAADDFRAALSARWTELWHTRLGVKGPGGLVDEETASLRTVRAVWTPDATHVQRPADACRPNPKTPTSAEYLVPLGPTDRVELVALSDGFTTAGVGSSR